MTKRDVDTAQTTGDRLAAIVPVLQEARSLVVTMPDVERTIALMAANGAPVWRIAHEVRQTEGAVWRTLDAVVAAVSDRKTP